MATFTVLVYDAEEGGYWAEVPELPGCGSQGETLDDLEHNVIEAIEACLAAYEEDGVSRIPRKVRKWDLSVPGRASQELARA